MLIVLFDTHKGDLNRWAKATFTMISCALFDPRKYSHTPHTNNTHKCTGAHALKRTPHCFKVGLTTSKCLKELRGLELIELLVKWGSNNIRFSSSLSEKKKIPLIILVEVV